MHLSSVVVIYIHKYSKHFKTSLKDTFLIQIFYVTILDMAHKQ